MSISDRMQNDGLSFEEACMKESLAAPSREEISRILDLDAARIMAHKGELAAFLRQEGKDAAEAAKTCLTMEARPAFAVTAAYLLVAAETLDRYRNALLGVASCATQCGCCEMHVRIAKAAIGQ